MVEISAGGNCGSQSTTLITRALALGEINPRDWFHVLWYEALMGASLGLALAVVGFLRAYFTPAPAHPPPMDFLATAHVRLSLVVALAVAVVVVWGNLVGALLPLMLKRAGFDPALMSNPVLASLVDVTGIFAYFAIAKVLLLDR